MPEFNALPTYDFSGVVKCDGQTLTSGTAITLNMSGAGSGDNEPIKRLTLDANTTITLAGAVAGQRVEVRIIQGTTGGTAAWSGVTRWVGGAAPALATTAGHLDAVLLTVEGDGTVTGEHLGAAS